MERINELLTQINDFVWGAPLIILLLGTGIYFTWRLKLLQLTRLKLAFSLIFRKEEKDKEGDVSSFQALCTALSSTIGTGNIVGVATRDHGWRARRAVLDVGKRLLRHGDQICGRPACHPLPHPR